MNPPVLPWHREAVDAIVAKPLPSMSQFVGFGDCMKARFDEMAQRIANCDPHAAQQQETARLLEHLCATVEAHEIESLDCDRRGEEYCNCLRKAVAKARAHLAAQRGKGGAT